MSSNNHRTGIIIYVVHNRAASQKEKGKWDVYEEVYIKNGIKHSLMASSTLVLDCSNMKVLKDRHATDSLVNTSEKFLQHINYLAQHHTEVAKVRDFINKTLRVQEQLEQEAQDETTEDSNKELEIVNKGTDQ